MAGRSPAGGAPAGLLARQGCGCKSACLALSLTDLLASTSLDGAVFRTDLLSVAAGEGFSAKTGAAATGTARTGTGGISCTPPGGTRRGGDGKGQGPSDKCWSMADRRSAHPLPSPPLRSARLGSARLGFERTESNEILRGRGKKEDRAEEGALSKGGG
jgi:hypothetical protein